MLPLVIRNSPRSQGVAMNNALSIPLSVRQDVHRVQIGEVR